MSTLKIGLLWLGIFSVKFCFSQTFGGFPISYKWQTINTKEVRVIFPKGMENQAQRLVNTIKYLDKHNRISIGEKERKINITLQNQIVISNGYVQLAPFKSEFFTNPLQESSSLGSMPWLDLLAIHEYRHVLQYANGKKGLSSLAYLLFGENGWGGANGLAVPNWFWEGDAVVTETALSSQGRGRLPAFFNPFRSLSLTNTIYSYSKLRNGSLKDYLPNHYNLGYLMCVYGRQTYGNDFWKNVFKDAVTYKHVFYPFSRSLYHRTGKRDNSQRFYMSTMYYFQEKWKYEMDTLRLTKAQKMYTEDKQKTVTNYEFPYFVTDTNVIVLKSSFKQIPFFTLIDKYGNETPLKAEGFSTDNYFHYKENKIVWTELRYNPRWSNFNYSVIKLFDIKQEESRTLTFKSKYFSPSLSQDASKIVAVEQSANQEFSLHIIDANSGSIVAKLPNLDNLFYTYPKFSLGDTAIISSVRNKNGEMALISQNIATGEIKQLTPFSNNVLGINFPAKDFVYFEASYSGIDNIYAVQYTNNQVYQLTSRPIGNYQPCLSNDGKTMVFSQFSKMGSELYTVNMDSTSFRLFNIINISQQSKFDFVAIEAEGGSVLNKVPNETFEISKYPQLGKLLNVHSWSPSAFHPNYGINILSENILNNFSLEGGYHFNTNEHAGRYNLGVSYGGFFPIINLSGFKNDFRALEYKHEVEETGLSGGFSVPLNLSKGIFASTLTLNANYVYAMLNKRKAKLGKSDTLETDISRIVNINGVKDPMKSSDFQSFDFKLELKNNRRKAKQNIYTHFGQYLNVQYKQSLNLTGANQLSAIYELAFPGFAPNHNFVIEGGYQKDGYHPSYRYTNNFYYTRGHTNYVGYGQELFRAGFNYHFPILYPDWGFAGIIYFLRIRGNLFYDYGSLNFNRYQATFQKTDNSFFTIGSRGGSLFQETVGGELIFDINWFNAVYLPILLRYNFNLGNSDPNFRNFEISIPIKRLN